jgi:NMD protein affecting ribosome stability and mRNA decay
MDYARQRVSELIDKGYMVVQSTKLHGKKNGKDIFRFYYSIKRPKFEAGDFIDYKDKIFRVRELAKNVKLNDLSGSRHTSASTHQLQDVKVAAKSSQVRKAIVTGLRPDGMQIMDCESCATHELPVKEGLKQGDELEYISIGAKVYLL